MKKLKRIPLLILIGFISICSLHAKNEGDANDNTVIFYFVRHGKTLLNTLGRIQGWVDAPLTSEGEAAVEQLGRGIKQEGLQFKSVYASSSARAKTTADLVLAESGQALPIRVTPALREVGFGSYEGALDEVMLREVALYMGYKSGDELLQAEKTGSEVIIKALAAIKSLDTLGIAEDYSDIKARAETFIREIAEQEADSGGGAVLVVSHGFTIGILLSVLDDDADHPTAIDVKNASVSKVVYKGGKFTIESIGDMHYVEAGKTAPGAEGR